MKFRLSNFHLFQVRTTRWNRPHSWSLEDTELRGKPCERCVSKWSRRSIQIFPAQKTSKRWKRPRKSEKAKIRLTIRWWYLNLVWEQLWMTKWKNFEIVENYVFRKESAVISKCIKIVSITVIHNEIWAYHTITILVSPMYSPTVRHINDEYIRLSLRINNSVDLIKAVNEFTITKAKR